MLSLKSKSKCWSLSNLWLTGKVTFQTLCDVFADIESDSVATRVHFYAVDVWCSKKGLKKFFLLGFWNSYAGVHDLDRDVRFPLSNHHFKQHKYLVSRLRKFRGVGNQVDKYLLDSLDVYPPKFITSKVSKLDVKIFGQDLSKHNYSSLYGVDQVVDTVVNGKHIVLKQLSVEQGLHLEVNQRTTVFNHNCHFLLLSILYLTDQFVCKTDDAVKWGVHLVASIGSHQI